MKSSTISRTTAWVLRFYIIGALLSILLGVTQAARADTLVVTNTNNSGPGSLRQAITDANNTPGPDTITFDAATDGIPIVLAGSANEDANLSGDLDILNSGNLVIQGNGVINTILDGGSTDRVFHVCPVGTCTNAVTLNGVTIRHGSVTDGGGGIQNRGTLDVQSSRIGDSLGGNTAAYGGGIYNAAGTTTVDNSLVSANTADFGAGIFNASFATLTVQNGSVIGAGNSATLYGGGIFNSAGTVTVDGCILRGNDAQDGGGIFNWEEGTLSVINSSIGVAGWGNTASNEGGGIFNEYSGIMTVDGSTVSANEALNGGGIFAKSTLTITNSTIGGASAGNIAGLFGGGIYIDIGTITVDNSTVSANEATNGGGIYNWATLHVQNGSTIGGSGAGNTAAVEGGGIYNQVAATTLVVSSTVSANTANWGGGLFNHATLNIQDGSTIGGAGGRNIAFTKGGGIYNLAGTTTITNSTVSNNLAVSGGGISNYATLHILGGSTIGGAGVGNQATDNGGGIYNENGTATLDASTVSANTADNGGGIYNLAALYVLNGSLIGGNDAGNLGTIDGGGIYNQSGPATVDESTISINHATTNGGGIYLNDGTLTVMDSRLLKNTAANGGAVYNNRNGSWVVYVTDGCIVGNSQTSFFNNQAAEQYAARNWWGAATGPNTPGADTVAGNVDYSDFLTLPIPGCGYDIYLPLVMD